MSEQLDKSRIKLRGHHLICTRLFVGEGYSDGFAANMEKLVALLKLPGVEVELVAKPDHVCSACPKLGESTERKAFMDDEVEELKMYVSAHDRTEQWKCVERQDDAELTEKHSFCRLDEVAVTDQKLLDRLGFEPGCQDTYENIMIQFYNNLTEEIFMECCGDCSWFEAGLCSYEKLLNRKL